MKVEQADPHYRAEQGATGYRRVGGAPGVTGSDEAWVLEHVAHGYVVPTEGGGWSCTNCLAVNWIEPQDEPDFDA